jgi:hypothetical protein
MIEREKGKNVPLDEFISSTGRKEGTARNDMERYALDCLENREVKQLYELLRRPNDKNLVVPQVVDKVGGMMTDTDVYIRNLATKVYVELLKKNPEFSTKGRIDKLDSQVKIDMFERLCDPDIKKREEAQEFVRYIFGISTDVSKALGGEEGLLKFHPTKQRREASRLLESFAEEVKGTKLDANAVFDEVRKLSKETGQHEFAEFKMMVRIAENLLSEKGSSKEYNECLEESFKLYKEINSRMTGADRERMLHKMFVDWIPDMVKEMGYGHVSVGLEELVEKVRKDPEIFKSDLVGFLRYGSR